MTRLIFLGFDGILHPNEVACGSASRFCWASILKELIAPWTDVRLVVCGNWCSQCTDADMLEAKKKLGPFFTESAPILDPEIAIESILDANKGRVLAHAVLYADKTPVGTGRFNSIACDPSTGISTASVQNKLRSWLYRTAPDVIYGRFDQGVPRGHDKLILYLDFDGVLHHSDVHFHPKRGAYMFPPNHVLFEHAEMLEELLRPYPELKIVLSTSWVRQYGCYGASKRLPVGLRNRVIGATFHSQMNELNFVSEPRGMQVWRDVVRRNPQDWLALDDDETDWPEWCRDKLIHTDEADGISMEGLAERISKRLRGMHAL